MTRILVIEDEADLREGLMDTLIYEGFDVRGAANGHLGVQAARKHLPDLIICDVMMPEMDGYSVLIELRSEPLTATIPFIFLTARADRRDMRKGMELGADDYLTKPFTQAELLGAINATLDKLTKVKQEYGQKLDDLRENLLRTLPHELRTPLTGIMGYGEMLMLDYDTLEPSQVKVMAEFIVRSGNRLYRLIENYLLYAQIEILKTDPDRLNRLRNAHTVNAVQIIQQTAQDVAKEAKREHDLHVEIEPVLTVGVSDDNLKKIIEELVSNAFKFSPEGSRVQVIGTIEDNSFMVIRIRDQGRGMTTDQIKQIGAYMQFERKLYEQQGLGLGLTIAKNLIELHRGRLIIESTLKQGTEVCIELIVLSPV